MATDVGSSHCSPNVIVPRQTLDTCRPVLPSRTCFMGLSLGSPAACRTLPATMPTTWTQPASPPRPPGPPRLVVGRTRPPPCVPAIQHALGGQLVAMGSAGAKAMAVVRGEVDVYAHSGGQYEWDSAAPVCVAAAAGLHTSRLDGSPLRYNQPDPYLPDLLICRPELVDDVLTALA